MRAVFNFEIDDAVSQSWSDDLKLRYRVERATMERSAYNVIGVILSKSSNLLIIDNAFLTIRINIYDIRFFELIDKKMPINWVFYTDISHPNIVYPGFNRELFSYVGVDHLINEPYFYESYLNGGNEEQKYVRELLR